VLVLGFGVGFALSELLADDDGGGDGSTAAAPRASGPPARDTEGKKSFLAKVVPPPAGSLRGARPPAAVARIVRSMSVEQKVAQVMLVGFGGTDATAPIFKRLPRRTYGGLMLEQRNYQDGEQFRVLTAELRAQVARSRQAQPFLGAVQQGGDWNALTAFPPEFAPAETESIAEGAALARTTARTFKRFGMNAIWAPSLEVGPEDGGAMGARAYSDEPEQVAAYGQTAAQEYADARVLAAPGRFPGLGAAAVPPEEAPPKVGLTSEELRRRDLVPYRSVIRAGVPAIVVGHGLYDADDFVTPASQSRAIAQNLLRGQLGFRGIAIADDLTLPAVTTTTAPADAAVRSLQAGVDMVYVPGPEAEIEATYKKLVAAVRGKRIPRGRIDEAVTRILLAKSDLRLLPRR
jgi:beta-N-acetylhexosaminidase